jgi:hypothetical protein
VSDQEALKVFSLRAWWGERARRHTLLCLVLSATASVWAGFFAPEAGVAGLLVRHTGYFFIAGLFTWWCFALLRDLLSCDRPAASRLSGSELRQMSLLVVGLLLVAVMTAPYDYKVLYDEYVLQTTAWNMHMEREVGALGRAYVLDGLLRSLDVYLDKRPILHPFLVSLTHDAFGYREANAFVLNTALFPVALGLVYLMGSRLGGHGAGLAGTASFGASSLLALNATGAGMEMVNLVSVLALACTAARFLERPDERSAAPLLLTGVLLAYARYESSIYVLSAGGVLLCGWLRAGRPVVPTALLAAPLLLIPCAWHNIYLSGTPFLWELRDGYEVRFSPDYLRENLVQAVRFFFGIGGLHANSIWLSGVGGLCGFICLWRVLRFLFVPQRAQPAELALGWCAGGAIVNLGLLMAYYWGDLTDPIVSRLILPFNVMLSVSISAVVAALPIDWRPVATRGAIAGSLLVYFAFHLPINQKQTELNIIGSTLEWERKVLAERGRAQRLIVSNKSPLAYFVRGQSATTISRLAGRRDGVQFHLNHGSFDEIVVTQTLRPLGAEGGFAVVQEDMIPSDYILEPIAEKRFGTALHRISLFRGFLSSESTHTLSSEKENIR